MHAIGVHIQLDGTRGGVGDHFGDGRAKGRVPLPNRVEDRLCVLRDRYHWVVAKEGRECPQFVVPGVQWIGFLLLARTDVAVILIEVDKSIAAEQQFVAEQRIDLLKSRTAKRLRVWNQRRRWDSITHQDRAPENIRGL